MLMFTVLACSSGPSQEEFDELKQQNQLLINELYNKPKLVDFIVTYKVTLSSDDTRGKIEYLVGDETKVYSVTKTTNCWKDVLIGAPLPLSCR